MKLIFAFLTVLIMSSSLAVSAAIMSSSNKELQATYRDIESTLGLVPTFMKAYPEIGLSSVWEEMKNVQLSKQTTLSGKEKELIGLAVASQIPCHYCVYFHTEVSKMNGANENEIKETIAMAAATRHWSTYIEGTQYNEVNFQKETNAIIAFLKKENEKPVVEQVEGSSTSQMPAMTEITDATTAHQDIARTLGFVPDLFKFFPEKALASAWKMMKSIELNPNTSLSPKVKELLALAVAAQVPCRNCIYYNTEAAKLNGASTDEIRETLAMASVTRFWSTVLNGSQINEQKFKREVGQIIKYVKSQNKRVGMSL